MKALGAIQESVFQHGHLMLGVVPLPDQHCPAVYANLLGSDGNLSACGGIVGDSHQQPQRRQR